MRDRVDALYERGRSVGKLAGILCGSTHETTFSRRVQAIQEGARVGNVETLVAGVKVTGVKQTFSYLVDMTRNRKNDRDMGFDVLRRAPDEWHMMEVADKTRQISGNRSLLLVESR